jgi:hypothetical protein
MHIFSPKHTTANPKKVIKTMKSKLEELCNFLGEDTNIKKMA